MSKGSTSDPVTLNSSYQFRDGRHFMRLSIVNHNSRPFTIALGDLRFVSGRLSIQSIDPVPKIPLRQVVAVYTPDSSIVAIAPNEEFFIDIQLPFLINDIEQAMVEGDLHFAWNYHFRAHDNKNTRVYTGTLTIRRRNE